MAPYLKGKTEAFFKMADAVLVLDDGQQLPVHSTVLAKHSTGFCEAFAAHKEPPLPSKQCRVPLEDCTEAEACLFLEFFYRPSRPLTTELEHVRKVQIPKANCQSDCSCMVDVPSCFCCAPHVNTICCVVCTGLPHDAQVQLSRHMPAIGLASIVHW